MGTRNLREGGGQCRRATVAPLVAVMLVVLLGFASLAVDVGYIYGARGEMQRTADASALAGASALLLDSASVHDRAIGTAVQNSIYQDSMTPDELNVLIGHWGAHSQVFTESSLDDPVTPNAVHVTGTRLNMPLFFARVFGFNETDVQKEAIALLGSGRCAGIWGLEGISATGSIVTDSYDSSQGLYGSATIHPNGDICSCQDIDVTGAIEIHGDAMYGEDYSFFPTGGSWEVWGVVDDHQCGVPSFDADFDAAALDNDNATIGLTDNGRDPFGGSPWDLRIGGNDSLTLTGGTYYFTSALLSGLGALYIDGPTTIFVTGPADFRGGGIFNSSENPSDLVIYCSDPTVKLRGGSGFYGAVVAPDSDVEMVGTSDFYGTLLARTLDIIGDAMIHVDETLVSDIFGLDPEAPVLVK